MSTAAEATAWHAISVDEVVKRLTTNTGKGLDAAEAANRLQKFGPNRLPEGKKGDRSCGSFLSSTMSSFTSCSVLASPS